MQFPHKIGTLHWLPANQHSACNARFCIKDSDRLQAESIVYFNFVPFRDECQIYMVCMCPSTTSVVTSMYLYISAREFECRCFS